GGERRRDRHRGRGLLRHRLADHLLASSTRGLNLFAGVTRGRNLPAGVTRSRNLLPLSLLAKRALAQLPAGQRARGGRSVRGRGPSRRGRARTGLRGVRRGCGGIRAPIAAGATQARRLSRRRVEGQNGSLGSYFGL